MSPAHADAAQRVLSSLPELIPTLEATYKDVHSHPELSMQETRTAGLAAKHLTDAGFEVTTGVGRTGVVGVLRNGDGPVVMLRADMDGLPIREDTGLPYASSATATVADGHPTPVGHMCGHDMHVTWLMGVSADMAASSQTELTDAPPAGIEAPLKGGLSGEPVRARFRFAQMST